MMTVSHLRGLHLSPQKQRIIAQFNGLVSTCAALSVAFALVGLSSSPVFAGHWDYPATTYSGTTVNVSGSQTETLDWAVEGGSRNGSASAYPGSKGSTTIDGTIKTKWTWVPDDPNDAAPAEIWVQETASADWRAEGSSPSSVEGTRSLSIGGTADPDTNNVLNTSGSTPNKSGQIGKTYIHKIPVSGGVAEVSCTLKTECHGGDGPTEGSSRSTSMYTSVGYRVSIFDGSAHASASFDLTPTSNSTGWETYLFVYGGPRPTDGTWSLGQGPGGPPGLYVHLEHTGLSADVEENAVQYYRNEQGTRPPLYVQGSITASSDVSNSVFTAESEVDIDEGNGLHTVVSSAAPAGTSLTDTHTTTTNSMSVQTAISPYQVYSTLTAKASTK